MRLIDAKNFHIPKGFFNDGINIPKIFKLLEMQPTIEAEPVRHGRWVEWWPPKHMVLTGEEMLYRCSVCDAKYADVEGMRYCPNCGAKMASGTVLSEAEPLEGCVYDADLEHMTRFAMQQAINPK